VKSKLDEKCITNLNAKKEPQNKMMLFCLERIPVILVHG